MTTVIDERVVEMRFNNADFEKNVAQSMKSLDELKKSLDFKEGAKSLESIGKASSNFRLTGITDTIQEATEKFSVMEVVGITAIAKITSSIMDMGTKFVKSVSVDQVSAGFNRYAEKTSAIQTIMAATAKDWDDKTAQMKYVEEQMSKLAWFTDETSYNFNDMVSNIGKFTSNNIDLETSVTAMQGIANWAAISGQNAQTASRAMYNMSQAMGAGAMKQIDWKSIENANMSTYQFKQTAAETAVELGRLKKVSEGLYSTLDGKGVFTLEQFRDELKRGWFDKEVMLATLDQYGQFTNKLYEFTEATKSNASDVLSALEDYEKGNLKIGEFAEEMGLSVEDATKALEELSSEELKTGQSALRAAQEAKTFGEAIDSVKDAVSTKWSETFELIFGNYLEAKKLWTGLANDLWVAFAKGGDERNDVLRFWKDLGGRNSLIASVINLANLLVKPLSMVKQAFKSMFPTKAEDFGAKLAEITKKFEEFTESLQPSDELLKNVYRTFKGLFTVGKVLLQIITSTVKAILPVTKPMGSLLEMVLQFTGYVGMFITSMAKYAEEVGWFQALTEGLATVFKNVISVLRTLLGLLGGGLLAVASMIVDAFTKIVTSVSNFLSKSTFLQKVIEDITKAMQFLKKTFAGTQKPIEKVSTVLKKSEEYFSAASTSTAKYGTVIKDTGKKSEEALTPLQRIGNVLKTVVAVLGLAATKVIQVVINVGKKIKEFFAEIKQKLTSTDEDGNVFVILFTTLFDKIKEILGDAKDAIKEFFDNLGIDTTGVTDAITTITGAMKKFVSSIDSGKVVAIMLSVVLLALIGEAISLSSKIKDLASATSGLFNSINKILKKQFFKTTGALNDLAKAFALIAGSLALLIYVDKGHRLREVAITMGVLVGVMSVLAGIMDFLSEKYAAARPLEANLHSMGTTLIQLAIATGILASAVAVLASIELDDVAAMWDRVFMVLGLLAGVVAGTIAISTQIKTMPVGAAVILALALSMKVLVNALDEFAQLPIERAEEVWPAYLSIFAGISVLTAAASLVSIKGGIGLILIAKAIDMMVPHLKHIVFAIGLIPVQNFNAAATILSVTVGFILIIAMFVEKMKQTGGMIKRTVDKLRGGSLFGGIGGALAGFGLAVFLIVSSIKKLKELQLTADEIYYIGNTMLNIVLALGLFTGFLFAINALENDLRINNRLVSDVAAFGIFFVGLAVAIRIVAGAAKTLSEVTNPGALWGAVAAISVMAMVMTTVVGVSGTVPKAIPAMAALIASTVAMGVLIGELAVLSLLVASFKENVGVLFGTLVIMALMFAALNITMRAMEKVELVKAGTIFALAATIGALTLAVAVIAVLAATNTDGVAIGILGVMGVLGVLSVLFTVIGQMDPPDFRKISAILAVGALLAAIGVSLMFASQQNWRQIAAAGGSIVAALIAISAVLIVLDKIHSHIGSLSVGGAVALIGLAIFEIAVALKVLEGIKIGEAAGKLASILGIVSGILAIFALLQMIPVFGEALDIMMIALPLALIAMASAFLIFAMAIRPIADGLNALTPALKNFAEQVPFLELSTNLKELAGALAIIALVGALVGVGGFGIMVIAAGIALLGGAASIATDALIRFSEVPLVEIAAGLWELGKAGALIGLVSPLIIAAGIALAGLGAAILLLGASFYVFGGGVNILVDGCNTIANTISGMVDGVKNKITELVNSFKDLFPDIANAFGSPKAKTALKNATLFGTLLGGSKSTGVGILGGIASALIWHSPPGMIAVNLMDDVGAAFEQNAAPVAAAKQSGTEIGNSFGSSMVESAQSWFGQLGASLSGWWSKTKSWFSGEKRDLTDLKTYGANGMPSYLLDTGKAAEKASGPFSFITDKVNEFTDEIIDTAVGVDKFDYIMEETEEQMKEATDQAKETAGGIGEIGEAAEKSGKSAKQMAKDLKSTIEGQLDIFSKFEIKTGVTAQTMIDNMKSNIDGFASWSHRMAVLAQRFAEAGIDKGLYQKLADLGPKGYETMNAFYEMSAEQLAEVKDLWATSLTLPQNQADIVGAGYQYMGEMAVQGFSNALDDHMKAHEAVHGFTKDVIETAAEDLGVHSPSTVFFDLAYNCILGWWSGAIESVHWAKDGINFVVDKVLEIADERFSKDNFYGYGENATLGLAEGLMDENAIAQLIAAVTTVTDIISKVMPENLQEQSPSRLTRGFGRYATEGLAIGMLDAAYTVEKAAASVTDTAVDAYQSAVDSVQDYADLNTTLLLTPILDMSYLDKQLSGIEETIGVTGQNGGRFSATPSEPQQINFTQNNYSPKALSSIDIYRQTKNQVSMLKGATAYA